MITTVEPATPTFGRLLILLGIMSAIAGAVGTLLLGYMLGSALPAWFDGRLAFLTFQLLFQLLWLIFFISMFVLGLSLIRSGMDRRRKDIVPGLTLYFLGAALAAIGIMLFTFGNLAAGVGLFIAGALAVYVEWSTEVV
jgi:tryptophan-rich sensory protein